MLSTSFLSGKMINFIVITCFIYGSNALSVEERLLELERVVKLQSVILENHEKTIQHQNVLIKNYEDINNQLEQRVESLENHMAKFENCKKISEQELPINIQNRSNNLDEEMENDARDARVRAINAVGYGPISTSSRSRAVEGQSINIAFHAYMTGKRCFQPHQVIVFDTETVDTGEAYSQLDGIYVVPVTGTYVFTWTMYSAKFQWYRADIIIDGVSKGWIIADSDNDQATGVVIAHVFKGSHVYVRKDKADGCDHHDELSRSTFSGWKLF